MSIETVHACNRRGIAACGETTPGRAQTNVEKYPENWDKVNCNGCIAQRNLVSMTKRREVILTRASDLMGAFLFYDRKEDDELAVGEIEAAIAADEITVDEIIEVFWKSFK